MIYLFFGEDKYRIAERLKELQDKIADSSGMNIVTIADDLDFNRIKNEVETTPFLADKKLVIIKNLLKSKNKELLSRVGVLTLNVPATTELVFLEESVDQRLSLFKTIQKCGKIESFSLLKGPELTRWITAKTKELNGEISLKEADKLGLMVGSDLVNVENELRKLVTFDPKITEESISQLIDAGFFDSIFALMDAISEKNSNKGLELINKFLDNDENEIYLLSMLSRQVRNLVMIKDLAESGKNESEITKISGLHPFVVKKTLAQVRRFEMQKLLKMHEAILLADKELKSSSIDAKVTLSRLVVSFTTS